MATNHDPELDLYRLRNPGLLGRALRGLQRMFAGPASTEGPIKRATRRFDLDCFVLFSSATVLVGNPGQANYVGANAFLEGLARRRRAEGLPALAVSWGAIGDVGYLARNSGVNRALAQRLGSTSLTAVEALAGLELLLAGDGRDVRGAVVGYARMDWSLVRKELSTMREPSLTTSPQMIDGSTLTLRSIALPPVTDLSASLSASR